MSVITKMPQRPAAEPRSSNFPDPTDADDPRAPPESGAPPSPPPDPFAGRFDWLADDLLNTEPPKRAYLLKRGTAGVLPLGKVGLLVAAGGIGKTLAECQLALSVALGLDFLGTFSVPTPGPVLLALAEEDSDEIHRRLHAAAASLQLSREERESAARKIVALPLAGSNVALTRGDGRGNVETTHLRDALRAHLQRMDVEWRLLILDPLSRWAGNDTEKDNHAATRFIEVVEDLTTVPGGPAVLLAHHNNKIARRAEAPAGAADARGASALTDGARWVANLEPDGPNVVIFRVSKSNYGAPVDPEHLFRDPDCSGAFRPMSPAELAEHEAAREVTRKQPGRAAVSDDEIDSRIVAALQKHGPQPSKRAIKRLGVQGSVERVNARVDALLQDRRIVQRENGISASLHSEAEDVESP